MILLRSEFLKLYNIHILGNLYIVGISLIAMELMFSEYIILLGQYLTLISDVISWIEEEHEFMSDKFIRKTLKFSRLYKLPNLEMESKYLMR